jgi:hypothetical protein
MNGNVENKTTAARHNHRSEFSFLLVLLLFVCVHDSPSSAQVRREEQRGREWLLAAHHATPLSPLAKVQQVARHESIYCRRTEKEKRPRKSSISIIKHKHQQQTNRRTRVRRSHPFSSCQLLFRHPLEAQQVVMVGEAAGHHTAYFLYCREATAMTRRPQRHVFIHAV